MITDEGAKVMCERNGLKLLSITRSEFTTTLIVEEEE